MGRMQVLTLGLVLVISWAGWASSAPIGANKAPYPSSHTWKVVGAWYTIYTASNDLQVVEWFVFMRYSILGFHAWVAASTSGCGSASGREQTLREADMEKFQKVLQEKGIGNEPVHFTNDVVCIDDYVINEQIQTMSSK